MCIRDRVILESTVPVGTTEKLSGWISEERPDLYLPLDSNSTPDIHFAHCPERVLPGYVLQELVSNDRIIGGLTKSSAERAAELYRTFVRGKRIITTARAAELSKLTENAYRDVNIAFANEMSMICESLEIDVWELINLANHHPRVEILQPGPGVGGHCIAVDPWFIVDSAPDLSPLIRTARGVNNAKPDYIFDKIKARATRFKQPNIACFGLAFKSNIDDLRQSPAMAIALNLAESDLGSLYLVEPNIDSLPTSFSDHAHVQLATISEALEVADIIVGLVDHTEFTEIGSDKLKEKIVIDTRGMWS